MEPIAYDGIVIERISRNGEARLIRHDLTQSGPAYSAKATSVFIRGGWLIARDLIAPGNPLQIFGLHKNERAGANLAAT